MLKCGEFTTIQRRPLCAFWADFLVGVPALILRSCGVPNIWKLTLVIQTTSRGKRRLLAAQKAELPINPEFPCSKHLSANAFLTYSCSYSPALRCLVEGWEGIPPQTTPLHHVQETLHVICIQHYPTAPVDVNAFTQSSRWTPSDMLAVARAPSWAAVAMASQGKLISWRARHARWRRLL